MIDFPLLNDVGITGLQRNINLTALVCNFLSNLLMGPSVEEVAREQEKIF